MSLLSSQNPHSEEDLSRYFYSLAEAYEKSGNLGQALESYEKLTGLRKTEPFDADARRLYRLGRVKEQMGDRAGAEESYRKFLALWKDADPVFPEIGDAKTRLESLGSS